MFTFDFQFNVLIIFPIVVSRVFWVGRRSFKWHWTNLELL